MTMANRIFGKDKKVANDNKVCDKESCVGMLKEVSESKPEINQVNSVFTLLNNKSW